MTSSNHSHPEIVLGSRHNVEANCVSISFNNMERSFKLIGDSVYSLTLTRGTGDVKANFSIEHSSAIQFRIQLQCNCT